MRTIEKQLIEAIKAGNNFSKDNTTYNAGSGFVTLHGNFIAKVHQGLKSMDWTLAGWPTVTTRSRLNALGCGLFNTNLVYQLKGEQRGAGDQVINPDETYTIQ